MTRRHYANNAPGQTLAASITNSQLSCQVSGSFAGWPTSFPFHATLDYGNLSEEIVLVTNIVGTTATIVRGQDGTAATSHSAGATIDLTVVALDFDEANAHVNANSGVHGRSGNVVGDSDVQTLTNKTLTNPTINGETLTGTVTNSATHLGNPALKGQASTAGGKSLSLRDSTGVEKASVLDSGAGTFASLAATGDGKVSGVHVTKSYTTEAAATTAGANVAGATVWLTAPTTGPVGLYVWDTVPAAWKPVQADSPFLGESIDNGTVTLAVIGTAYAGLATVVFTLTRQTRVKIEVETEFNTSGAVGTYQTRGYYNSGSTPNLGANTAVGITNSINFATVRPFNGHSQGTALLAAGTYTAYAVVKRSSSGASTDTAGPFYTLVTALGNV